MSLVSNKSTTQTRKNTKAYLQNIHRPNDNLERNQDELRPGRTPAHDTPRAWGRLEFEDQRHAMKNFLADRTYEMQNMVLHSKRKEAKDTGRVLNRINKTRSDDLNFASGRAGRRGAAAMQPDTGTDYDFDWTEGATFGHNENVVDLADLVVPNRRNRATRGNLRERVLAHNSARASATHANEFEDGPDYDLPYTPRIIPVDEEDTDHDWVEAECSEFSFSVVSDGHNDFDASESEDECTLGAGGLFD